MTVEQNSTTSQLDPLSIGIAWCLAWGEGREPQFELSILEQMRQALSEGKEEEVPIEVRAIVEQLREFNSIPEKGLLNTLEELQQRYPDLWNQQTPIGLVYGGPTKIKQYVFESDKIQEIRGASALLERINSIDLPAFFGKIYKKQKSSKFTAYCDAVKRWLDESYPPEKNSRRLSEALIEELIVYSTGGNILAFCPAAFVNDLANAIERRYTEETLTANSCAVGDTFKLLEIRFGLLKEPIETTPWLEWYHQNSEKPLVQAYFGKLNKKEKELCNPQPDSLEEIFENRKSFNEIAAKLAIQFHQRRSGNDSRDRLTRRHPPMFETHPLLVRDGSNSRLAVFSAERLPGEPWFSEASARKRLVGERAKTGEPEIPQWYKDSQLKWERGPLESWVQKFKRFLKDNPQLHHQYYQDIDPEQVETAQSLTHVSNASKNFIAYIYADGNNFGGFIQKIRTPKAYKKFSDDTAKAIEVAVYQALASHLHPHTLSGLNDEESTLSDGDIIHPFEIITIGGDDILLVVPANQGLAIAKTIGEQFEKILLKEVSLVGVEIKGNYRIKLPDSPIDLSKYHRYRSHEAIISHCKLSLSIGVLIAAKNTPIYYAQKLAEQLLKSAKERAKELKQQGYCGGILDFLTLKSVTMISSSIKEFRNEGLTNSVNGLELKMYAAPYTLHEISGLLETVKALKQSDFPRSQLYQIRSLLERGKHTAILNYLYFRTRLKKGKGELIEKFEQSWCKPKDEANRGTLAPWMSLKRTGSPTIYETIWRDLVDIYEFIEVPEQEASNLNADVTEVNL